MARRKRRRSHGRRHHRRAVARVNAPRRHRRRHYRRNQGFSRGRGIVRSITEGLKCGSFVVLGEAVSVTVPSMVRLPTTGLLGAGVIGLTGTVLGMVAGRFIGGTNTQYFVAGAWAKAIKQAIAPYAASIPLIGPGLAGYTPAIAAGGRRALSGYVPRGGSSAGVSAADDGSGYVF